ncbi:hypothetical protein VTJ04DRAFT_1484 [Mycothermus thermophilus]|uniref:uncharacterized protein n=1 Tax=Humicola insolens TaxID=85995 RepID=UPI0037441EB6
MKEYNLRVATGAGGAERLGNVLCGFLIRVKSPFALAPCRNTINKSPNQPRCALSSIRTSTMSGPTETIPIPIPYHPLNYRSTPLPVNTT